MKLRYEDILIDRNGEMELKDETALKDSVGWWYTLQIKNLLLLDKRKGGIKLQYVDLDKIWFEGTSKMIFKLYKYCIRMFTADESIKVQMLSWANNLGRVITMDEWDFYGKGQ